ncbi:MAG: penicillin acylase family protein [Gemmatimonadota bacterium]|uniref:penicillin acylase family protein n=1 Tax=Candidatus Palauibacter scopulicola TaxID=3056741 RepID=UPI00238349DA|nr:penicillin acylase family protein [Candidatus Palauibacter scopulicola]MDE2663514.1 penicillin acylase family protein [Candidatus Palauibacter scopulicola]
MSLRRRAGVVLAAGLAIVGVLTTLAWFHLQRSMQPRSGRHVLPGLTAPVAVTFDEWAIPSIAAGTELDAVRVQGFIHASERLWQMELFQRVARGRLAELFGPAVLDADRLMRTLDLWSAAGRELDDVSETERALLEAYAEGVNARIASWRGPWPPEFLILGIEPQPWSPRASVSIGRIMSLDLSDWREELDRMTALATLDADHRRALGAGYPAWGPTILQDTLPSDTPPPRMAFAETPIPAGPKPATSSPDPLTYLSRFGFHASNSWALAGSRTADGAPLLANDMHLALRAPSTWYLNSIAAEDSDLAVAGLSIPGTPGVIVGLNRNVAWSFTNAEVDDADFVVEGINLDGSMYRDSDDWRPFEARTEEIFVRGRAEPETWVVRSTVRGPVITDVVPAGGLTLSLLWTGLEPGGPFAALLEMNRAADADAFVEAVARFRSPHQNVIHAASSGEIGYRMAGSVPLRGAGEGASPISFERLPGGWPGFWPPEAMPALRDPERGYLVSANNLQARALFGRVGVYYPPPFRARRIDDLVSRASGWTVEDMRETQLDSHSLWAERYRPRAVRAARRAGLDSLAHLLERWDLRTETESRGAAPFFTWLYRLRELIVADEYDGGEGWFPDLAFMEIVDTRDSAWIDDARTPGVERLETLEEEAARTAVAVSGSAWGEVHRERSAHPLGTVPWLDRLFGFHVGPYPSRGGPHTVRPDAPSLRSRLDSTAWRWPVVSEAGPSSRFVARAAPSDMAGYFLLPTGQAGNPLDPHYRDMGAVWTGSPLIELRPGRPPARVESELHFVPGAR